MIFLQQLLNGLVIGSSYALVAVGFTLIFGVLRIVFFANSAVLVAGAYVGYLVLSYVPSIWLALPLGMAAAALLGLLIEFVAIRPVRNQHPLIALVTTISAATIVQEVLRLTVQQGQPVSYPDGVLPGLIVFGTGSSRLHVTVAQSLVFVLALVLFALLAIVVQRSWFGRAVRAVADTREIASMLGVRVNAISAGTVALASGLTGAAGIMLSLTLPAIDPYIGESLQFKALAIALFGGLGSLAGAVIGGFLLGLVEALAAGYLDSSYRDLFAYLTMVVILLVRPSGLLGRGAIQRV